MLHVEAGFLESCPPLDRRPQQHVRIIQLRPVVTGCVFQIVVDTHHEHPLIFQPVIMQRSQDGAKGRLRQVVQDFHGEHDVKSVTTVCRSMLPKRSQVAQ